MKRAFTLIELLVVIAIIAILAAILFPVFAQAKLAAKKTQDLSNQKNITTSAMMYSTDSDDVFPRCEYKTPDRNFFGWNVPVTWREALMPYVKNGEGQYVDGTRITKVAVNGIWTTPAYGDNATRGNYIINRNLSPGRCYWNGNWTCDSGDTGVLNPGVMVAPSVSVTQLDQPADTNFMTNSRIMTDWNASGDYPEGAWWWWGGAQFPPVFSGPTSHEKWDYDTSSGNAGSRGEPNAMVRYRYSGGTNQGFADGHAKYVKKSALNWCKYIYIKGLEQDFTAAGAHDDWSWLFGAGQPCAAFAR